MCDRFPVHEWEAPSSHPASSSGHRSSGGAVHEWELEGEELVEWPCDDDGDDEELDPTKAAADEFLHLLGLLYTASKISAEDFSKL